MRKSKHVFAQKFRELDHFISISRLAKVSFFYLILTVIASVLAAFFSGICFGLLIPLLKGLLYSDFGFIRDFAIFKLLKQRYPTLVPNESFYLSILIVAVVFGAGIAQTVCQYAIILFKHRQVEEATVKIRQLIFNSYTMFGKLFFDRVNKGYLHDLLHKSVAKIESLIYRVISVFQAVLFLLVYLSMMILISWKLTVFVACLLLAYFLIVRRVSNKLKDFSNRWITLQLHIGEILYDFFSCLPLIKAYAAEEEAKRNFNLHNKKETHATRIIHQRMEMMQPMQEALVLLLVLGLTFVAAYFATHGYKVELSVYLVYFCLLRRSAPYFYELAGMRIYFVGIGGSLERVMQLLDSREDKYIVPDGNEDLLFIEKGIELKNLSFSYGYTDVPVLKNVSFTVEKGKMTAIVGRTGGGKTTLIHLLLRFYDCPPGSIFIDGKDIRDYKISSLMKHFAFVSQEPLLFNDTFRHNIGYGLNGGYSEAGLVEVSKKAKIYDLITSLPEGYDTYIGDRGVKLSGGEKQRVQLARAMFKGSEVLLLDEATSSLDTQTERFIQEAIDEALKTKTAIVIAHRLSTIQHADKIIVLEDGEVKEQGTLNDLLTKRGRFYELWQAQKFSETTNVAIIC